MMLRFALGLALIAVPSVEVAADAFSEWCAQATLPSSIAICSDAELRSLAIERQHVFDEARERVGEDRAPALLADQHAWVATYARACGISPDSPPRLPLAPQIKDCMARAGRTRIDYLRLYGTSARTPPTPGPPSPEGRVGPGFDCSNAAAPLGRLVCANPELARTDLRFNQVYYALWQQLAPNDRGELQDDDQEFFNSVRMACGVPDSGPAAGSPECVSAHYERKRSEWLAELSGPAYEEANRPIEQHLILQQDLQRLGYLPATAKIIGIYGPATRAAISAWQRANGRPETAFIGNSDAALLLQTQHPQIEPVQTTAPSPAFQPSDKAGLLTEVQLKDLDGLYAVPARINDAITLDFTLDSGASDVLIPADVVLTLFRTGTLNGQDFIGERTYILADGSKLPSARFTLRELRVGEHRLANVAASVGPVEGGLLLGQSFLARFKSWTLDNKRHVLVLTE
jgi:uncharacterized protein/predicted aspartyl protease